MDEDARRAILDAHGAAATNIDELLHYLAPRFAATDIIPGLLPLDDEPFAAAWRSYSTLAEARGVFATLQDKLPQLKFPVEPGISETAAYRAATRQGKAVGTGQGLALESPDALELLVNETPAGSIPVLIAGSRSDFVTLVQALSGRNEPIPVPDSMGASTVMGFNNWDRVAAFRKAWEADNPGGNWMAYFPQFAKRSELYQDRFIILSQGPYSNVPASWLGYDEATWQHLSMTIRLEHECAHYFTLRVYGSTANNLFDEIIADYAGVRQALDGRFDARWFLTFMGLESYPTYREGGRMQNYSADLSSDATRVLQSMLVATAANLEIFSTTDSNGRSLASELLTLCGMTLPEMAAPNGAELMQSRLARLESN